MPDVALTPAKVTIIVPVYSDWPSLKECIKSLKKYAAKSAKIMFVNDCGPEVDLMERKIKRAIGSINQAEYYRNPRNLGFVKTCNRAVLELDKSANDVLLLNSDTKVTKGFLEEMTAALNSSKKVAAVCPRSNNATIFSVPVEASVAAQCSMKASYKVYKKLKPELPATYTSPIAHGFCMLINRSVIKKYGLFDEVYGKGYGEENDFCMRVHRQGYRCAVANRAFVFHFKARSFTQEKRDKLVAKNEKILDDRYPEYRQEVKKYWDNITPVEFELPRKYLAKFSFKLAKRLP